MGLQQCTPVTMCMSVNGIVTQAPFCIICCQVYLMQGRLGQVLSTEICMKVSQHKQILFKMLCKSCHSAMYSS